jgi:hypothetical protein
MRKGLDILHQTVGVDDARYLAAEIAYSQVLDRSGAHAEAARLKKAAEESLAKLYRDECVDCRVSVAAFP